MRKVIFWKETCISCVNSSKMYADDTTTYFNLEDSPIHTIILKKEIDKVTTWLKANKLSLNVLYIIDNQQT